MEEIFILFLLKQQNISQCKLIDLSQHNKIRQNMGYQFSKLWIVHQNKFALPFFIISSIIIIHNIMEADNTNNPSKYFDLIQIVGSKGKYQRNIFLIFCINWFVSGMLLMGTSFLYMNPSFNCEGTVEQIKQCEKDICAKDPSEWSKYLRKPYVESLATEFGPYLCSQKNVLNQYRMALYVGAFLGYSVFLFITDNYGRKTSALVAWGVTTLGVLLLSAAPTMWIASVGLVLAGAGCQSSLRISLTTVGQIVDYYKRQSYSILLQLVFAFAGIAVGLVYWWLEKWRIITIIFCLVPCVLYMLFLIFYLEETPKFLIMKQGVAKTMKALNRIGKINTGNPSLMQQTYIKSVNEQQNGKNEQYEFIITPYHLFKFKSLRKGTILCSIIFMCSTYLYYGPVVIVDKLGSNPFISQIIIGLSQFLACPISYWFIQKLARIKAGKISYICALIFNGILIFVNPGEDCKGCALGYLQISLVFASRFVVSFFSSILFLYATEIFPLRARGLGFGFISAMGAIASSSGQFIFSELQDNHINPMIFFSLFSLIALIVFFFMKQTLNQPLEDQIAEIEELKKKDLNAIKSEDLSDRDDIITSKTDEEQQNGQGLLEEHK